ncbi:hypothetical protein [Halobacillus sp. A5]|uniref:hypothetical protein n=1 Tax=Halobacillus sp. A5 TaxID=2880263 RepID=UPI0020A6C763|nr:hypothetical protein [Halobacillus sp. A5]MCP3026588.1 hypothetical protein [Halobacillus sp. A5]
MVNSNSGLNLGENSKTKSLEGNSHKTTEKHRLIYDISMFLHKCILSKDYTPSQSYSEAIVLNDIGQEVIEQLLDKLKTISKNGPELKLATVLSSPGYIDLELSNFDLLLKTVHEEIKNKKLLFPYVFGRELYDKFFDMYGNDEEINYEETLSLLDNTPNGVFQVNDLLTGPFGLLKSTEFRNYSPVRDVPIRHCQDTSCHALHITSLMTASSVINELINEIREIGQDFQSYFPQLTPLRKPNFYDDNNLENLPDLLGTFPEGELKILLSLLINKHKEIRASFPKDHEFNHIWNGDGWGIANTLQHSQCMQLILLFKDNEIAEALERLIYDNKINISSSEIRRPYITRKRRKRFNLKIECSRYGLRCTIDSKENTNIALIRLKNLITKLYSESDQMEKLEWKLRNIHGDNFVEKLEKYLLNENPQKILINLIFDNADYVKATFNYLKYGDFEFPYPSIKEEYILNKILWKLGFNSMSYPDYLNVFWKRHEHFLKIIKISDVITEEERETIRSSGVNYFVSLEEILDYSLSFITWSLLADHYLDTKFEFNLEDARKFMVRNINDFQYYISDTDYLVLDSEGKNTLYPLIKGFVVVAEICEDYLNKRSSFKRPISEFPSYHNKTNIFKFPFDYKIFLLNLNESDVRRLIENLKEITSILENANVSNVRNRIKHNRPIHEFPKIDELEKTSRVIEELVNKMEVNGIIPQLYIYSGTEVDQFGRGVTNYRNYNNVLLQLSNNSQFIRCGLPDYMNPQLTIPNVNINNSIEKPRFLYQDKTLYSNYWEDYPKRKIQNEEECDNKEMNIL